VVEWKMEEKKGDKGVKRRAERKINVWGFGEQLQL
jgi:hypothetical protein